MISHSCMVFEYLLCCVVHDITIDAAYSAAIKDELGKKVENDYVPKPSYVPKPKSSHSNSLILDIYAFHGFPQPAKVLQTITLLRLMTLFSTK